MASAGGHQERIAPADSPAPVVVRPSLPPPAPLAADMRNVAEAHEEPIREDPAALFLENSPPWLFSMVFHMLMMIVMGMIAVYVNIPSQPIHLEAEAVYSDKLGDQLVLDAPLGVPDAPTTAEHALLTPENLPPVADPLAAPGNFEMYPEGLLSSSELEAAQIGLALSGREAGSVKRRGLIGRYGGTALTEAAVEKGLAWLARNQQPNGSWSLAGPYGDGVAFRGNDNPAAATAMALLAFQGAGNTHRGGKYQRNVANAWRWLLKQQDATGCFFRDGPNAHRFYTHAQCSIAVCELYGMTKDDQYKYPAQRAIEYCVQTQAPPGGWRYNPNIDSDVSVTGWVAMALQSGRMAGLDVPEKTLGNLERFLDDVAQQYGSRYPYQQNGDIRLAMTAEALLIRQYLGWKRNDRRLAAGVKWITSPENLIDFEGNRDVYYWYYATQVAHHMGGDYWTRWNKVMREVLPAQQVARGKEAGSWDPNRPVPDQWSTSGGRLYVTCLSICMLEVYYRHLPIYSAAIAR